MLNGLRHIRPRYILDIGGVFVFLLVVPMDIVEAKRNLEVLEKNRSRLMNYNHLYSSYAFKEMCGAELRKVNKQIHGIEEQLNAQSKKTRSNMILNMRWR